MKYALELKNVSKNYGDFVLDNINLALPRGNIMGFIGENGAGKSTTIKLILDIIGRDSGSITLLGQDNKSDKNLKNRIGIVLDESCFPENLSAKDINIIMKNIYRTWEEKTYLSYIERFSLPNKKPVKEYSRGMTMKLSIAVALSHGAELLILDEATSGLDPVVRDEILDVFLEFISDENNSILVSSHIVTDLEKICDYITYIHKGKIVFTEAKDELFDKYGILKCSNADFERIDKNAIKGYRKNSFGVEALIERSKVYGQVIDRASIEDIMVYYSKGAK